MPTRSLFPLILALGACESSMDGEAAFDSAGFSQDSGATAGPSEDEDGDTGTPSEDESDYLKLAPAATDQYVFVANPDRDTLTRIAVSSLQVVTVEVGRIPSTVQTTSDYRLAVTLDEGDDAVSIVYAETLEVFPVEIRDNMNQLSLSPNGEWAMAWFDPDAESMGSSGGVTSFNEVSFVRTDPATHFPMAVGYDPAGVRWSDDGRRAVVVSDGALAVVELAGDTPARTIIPLVEDDADPPVAEEVVLTPDGRYAFVRQRGADDLLVVDLDNGVIDRVVVGTDPTDMDVTVDNAFLAVMARSARQIWSYDLTNPYATPDVVDFPVDLPFGSITFTGDGERALLYTNAAAIDALSIWEVGTTDFDTRSLVKPVASVGLSPAGTTALVFHTRGNTDDADANDPFYNKWALTLLETASIGENRLLLPSEPTGYTVTDDDRYGFFILDGYDLLEAVDFSTLIPTTVSLPSQPAFIGTLPGHDVAWASQAHELGRISFYDATTDSLDTITGFELNSDIEH
ncbi:MAG: hypothetical protein EXR71_05675 [Myxococcales bacterium]|nr:hypothetical protein [Myxococcales bacterium]